MVVGPRHGGRDGALTVDARGVGSPRPRLRRRDRRVLTRHGVIPHRPRPPQASLRVSARWPGPRHVARPRLPRPPPLAGPSARRGRGRGRVAIGRPVASCAAREGGEGGEGGISRAWACARGVVGSARAGRGAGRHDDRARVDARPGPRGPSAVAAARVPLPPLYPLPGERFRQASRDASHGGFGSIVGRPLIPSSRSWGSWGSWGGCRPPPPRVGSAAHRAALWPHRPHGGRLLWPSLHRRRALGFGLQPQPLPFRGGGRRKRKRER